MSVFQVMTGGALLGAIVCAGGACGADATGGDDGAGTENAAGDGTSEHTETPVTPTNPGIDVDIVGDAAFFLHHSQDHNDALLEGPASILNGCLAVGDPGYVIIWHDSWQSQAAAMLDLLQAGMAAPFVSLGGGEVPSNIPYAGEVRARCGTDRVWEASPVGE